MVGHLVRLSDRPGIAFAHASRCTAELDALYHEAVAPDASSTREAWARSNRRRGLERVLAECDARLGLVSAGKTIDEFLVEAASV